MRKTSILICSILLLLGCNNSNSVAIEQTNGLINQLKEQYAPDKRVAIWDLEAQPQGTEVIIKGKSNLPNTLELLKQQLADKSISYIDSIQVLPDEAVLGEQIYGVVNLSACNIRSQAKHSGELATQSTLGTTLKVYEKSGDWYRVQTPDGYLGWLDKGGFTLMDERQLNEWKTAPKVVYLPDMGFSYKNAQQDQRVSDLLAGNLLSYLGKEGNYTKVGYPDGRVAIVPSSSVQDFGLWLQSRAATADNILQDAQAMLGRPYLWGGTSGKAFDCSGFTKTVFYLNGLILPRDASQQVHVGQAIETNDELQNLIPGDLLFFGRKASAELKEKITHVAIYMGDGKIIHATGQVKIESLKPGDTDFAPDRLETFVRAKRMLDKPEEFGIASVIDSEWY